MLAAGWQQGPWLLHVAFPRMVVPPVLTTAAADVSAVLEMAELGVAIRVCGVYTVGMGRLETFCIQALAEAVPVRHVPQHGRFRRPRDRCQRHPTDDHRFVSLVRPIAGRLGRMVPD